MLFGFGIGINVCTILKLALNSLTLLSQVTNAVFLGEPAPLGFGFSQIAIAGAYGTPIVAVVTGELTGRYVNDWIMNVSVRRNSGVFEAESRLWYAVIHLQLPSTTPYLNIGPVISLYHCISAGLWFLVLPFRTI